MNLHEVTEVACPCLQFQEGGERVGAGVGHLEEALLMLLFLFPCEAGRGAPEEALNTLPKSDRLCMFRHTYSATHVQQHRSIRSTGLRRLLWMA